MPKDYLWIYGDDGEPTLVHLDELDPDVVSALLRPIGGFCFEANSFIRLPLPKVPFFIKGWLPKQGRLEIYAPPKTGKSFLAQQMARCIASGQPFLGMPTVQGKVLFLQFELGAEILQSRMKDTGKDYDGVYVGCTFDLKLDTTSGQDQLVRALEAIQPDVLIFDPFYKMLRGDENEIKDVRNVLDFLDSCVIEIFKCSVVIIHHPGKNLSLGGRGSSVLEDWHDTVVEMKRQPQQRAKLTPKLMRHAETPPEGLLVAMKNFEFELAEAPQTIKSRVEKYLKDGERAVSLGGIEEHLGTANRKSIYDALNGLMQEGVVNRPERGVYTWVGRGDEDLE